jgi:hypothetical protein
LIVCSLIDYGGAVWSLGVWFKELLKECIKVGEGERKTGFQEFRFGSPDFLAGTLKFLD